MSANKLLVAAALAAAIGAPFKVVAEDTKVTQPMTSTGVRAPFLHRFPAGKVVGQSELVSLERANQWLNSPPLTAPALRGKVVLIDFWTYTCINWLRTLPYVRAWAEKYQDHRVPSGPSTVSSRSTSGRKRRTKAVSWRMDEPS